MTQKRGRNKFWKSEENLPELLDLISKINIIKLVYQKDMWSIKREECLFKEILVNFPKLWKELNLEIHEANKTLHCINVRRPPRHTVIRQFHFWLYAKEMKTGSKRDTNTPIFTAALFTIANIWKQSKCQSTDEWKKVWYIYIYMIYTFSASSHEAESSC